MPKVKVTEIIEGLYHLEFPTLYLMNSTLIRFQEYYESPKFKGMAFTLEEYMDWYAGKAEDGRFDYFDEVEGMNFPADSMSEFEHFHAFELGDKEYKSWVYFQLGSNEHAGYLIATAKTSQRFAFKHEIAHGMYYLIPAYKREVSKVMNSTAPYKAVIKTLKKALKPKWYHRSIMTDECHAYLIDGISAVNMHAFTGIGRMMFKDLSRKLRKIYKKHDRPHLLCTNQRSL